MSSILNVLRPNSNANEILPDLWLGDYHSALDTDFLNANGINVIINCTQSCPFVYELSEKPQSLTETYRIPVNDSLLEADFIRMERYLRVVVPLLLRKYTIEKRKILVHCHAGKQRSAIVVAALLKVLVDNGYFVSDDISVCKRGNSTQLNQQFNQICNYLLSKRHNVFTYGFRVNFTSSYRRFFNIRD